MPIQTRKNLALVTTVLVVVLGTAACSLPARALTASNGWGVSAGDVLYYEVKVRGVQVTTLRFNVTETSNNGTYTFNGTQHEGAYVLARAYAYFDGWNEITGAGGYPLAVYDPTTGLMDWSEVDSSDIGGAALEFQPFVVRHPFDIDALKDNITRVLESPQVAEAWGTTTVTQDGNRLVFDNGTHSFTVAYNANSVLTELSFAEGDTTQVSLEFSETEPENLGFDIPGVPVSVVIAAAIVPVVVIAARRRRDRRRPR